MLYQVLKQEIKYTLSFPLVYLSLIVYIISFTFLFARKMHIIGVMLDNEWLNSPHAIAANTIFFTLLGMMIALPIFNNAGNREYQYGFQEILFTTPISKFLFFFGRFLGAFCLISILGILFPILNYVGVQIGLVTGQILPTEIGPFRIMPFLKTFIYIVLPNIFIVGSIVFSLAVSFKNFGFSILGAIALNALYLMALYGFGTDINYFHIGSLIDPFGEFAFNTDTRYQTILERHSIDISLSGHLLKNRIFWVSASAIILAMAYWKFTFQRTSKKAKKTILSKPTSSDIFVNQVFPSVERHFGKSIYGLQFKSFFQTDFWNIISHLVYKLFVFALSAMVIVDFINRQHDYGVPDFPVTYRMIENLRDYDVLVLIFLVYFSGELVWNNRKNNIHEVVDAAPYSTVLSVFSKVLASWLAIIVCYVVLFIVCIGIQFSQGFFDLDLLQYATELVIQIAPFYLFVACFSIFIQMLVNHKFVGYTLVIFFFIGQNLLFTYLDIESNMVRFGQNGGYTFSDMNRYGPFLKGNIYFAIYWIASGLVLLIPTVLFWVRSEDSSILKRWKISRQNWSPNFLKLTIILGSFWLLMASFVFYNTKILNQYSTRQQTLFSQEQYERLYKKYEHAKLTNITNAQFFIDIFPVERTLKSKTVLTIKNSHQQAIDSLFFSTRNINRSHGWDCAIHIPNASLVLDDTHSGFQIYKLATPLQAQDSLVIEAIANYNTQGFENAVENDEILDNGTFIHHAQLLPYFGYRKENEIRDKTERIERNLPERIALLPLELDSCLNCSKNQLSDQHSWLNMETTISTTLDQTAVTSGRLVKKWTDNNRQYFHYQLDHASLLFNSFISARYEVARRTWQGIDLEVYYDKKHAYNVEYMLDEMENAMEYYIKNFGPYFHQQVRIIEFPRYGNYAQAFPGTMPYSESRGFILDYHPETDNSPIASTVGHEIAHQWWGHQIVSAEMEGSQFLIESFAEYASLMLMKKNVGTERMIEFLKYDYDNYLFLRNYQNEQEKPLYKVGNQPYIYYRKGSVVMYALATMIGEEKVNRSMRQFLNKYRYKKPPFPRSIDYLDYLEQEVPDSLKYLIQDLFFDITFFENSIENATVKTLKNEQFEVEISLRAQKLKLDNSGLEHKVPIQDWFELGFYFKNKDKEFLLKKVKLDNNQKSWCFVLDDAPEKVVLDPRFLFFDRNLGDNEIKF